MDHDLIKLAVNEVLDERERVDSITHRAHHAYIAQLLDREQRRSEFWCKIKQQVVGWGIIALIGGTLTAIGAGVAQMVQKG